MHTDVVLIESNYPDDAFANPVRFSVVSNGVTLARIETDISGQELKDEKLEAAMRNRIHEVTEILDDWIRQNRRISQG